jgi:hypothetical protein
MTKLLRGLRAAVAVASFSFLAACGGGSGSDNTAEQSNKSGVVAGTVTGFGSIVIDGVEYAEARIAVSHDVDPRAEQAGTMADVKLGQQVEALLDAEGHVVKLVVRATLVGPVQAVDVAASSFKVVGQTVKVVVSGEGKTIFQGVDGLADLRIDDWVEVHGIIDADRNIVATRVELRPAEGVVRVRAGGIVTALDDTAQTFKLGDLTVNYASAVIKPEGAALANGDLVFVFSDQLPSNNTLNAKAIRVARKPTLEGRNVTIGGLVTDAAADGKTFKINGVAVDATTAEVQGGTFADIKNMTLVRVQGSLTEANGAIVLKAARVTIIPAPEQRRVLLIGQVTDFVSAASFKVRGVPVNADAATFTNGTKDDLKNGAFVLVHGKVEGNVVAATEVTFVPPPTHVQLTLFGTVSDFDATAKTFKLLRIPMQLAADVTFENGTAADFKNGATVEVKGAFDGRVFVVTKVVFKQPVINPLVFLRGVISDVTDTSFKLDGTTVKIDAQTIIVNGPLANGQHVAVFAQLVNGEVVARRIEVQVEMAVVLLFGPVTDFESSANFKVQGQVVDASAATFVDGTAADLANGRLVRIVGTLEATTVQATRVTFLHW